ncbi:MAG: inositol monophosphatase [Chloroflexota bacterium]|nr:inositol monophosphatase [Chloroflexota bacterium]
MKKEPLDVAIEAAKTAGHELLSHLGRATLLHFKEPNSPVTKQDLSAEELIVSLLRHHFPEHAFLTEERGHVKTNATYRWHIDPLDGTKNYLHGYPHFAVSLALERVGELLLAVVYDPIADELFTAQRNGGGYLNGQRISVSKTTELTGSLLATNFHNEDPSDPDSNTWHWMRFMGTAQGVRSDGSAALDLCYVAAGRLDGFWSLKVKPWDLAAGVLMVGEADGLVTDRHGEPFGLSGKSVLATNGQIHTTMVQMLGHHDSGDLAQSALVGIVEVQDEHSVHTFREFA